MFARKRSSTVLWNLLLKSQHQILGLLLAEFVMLVLGSLLPPKVLDLVMPSCSGTCATSEAAKDHQLILRKKKRGCGIKKKIFTTVTYGGFLLCFSGHGIKV